jgi:hypothetical protein
MNSGTGSTHRVLMQYMERREGWHVAFLEADCQTSLPVKLTFATADKIRIMYQRFGSQLQDDKHALEHGISIGRGGPWLTLNEEQYQRLGGAGR